MEVGPGAGPCDRTQRITAHTAVRQLRRTAYPERCDVNQTATTLVRPRPRRARLSERVSIVKERSLQVTDGPLRVTAQAADGPGTPHSQPRDCPKSRGGPSRDSARADQSPCEGSPEAPQGVCGDSARGGTAGDTGREGPWAGLPRGWQLLSSRFYVPPEAASLTPTAVPAPLRTLDRWRWRCPLCHRRPRQYKGRNPWTGDRDDRMLCAPCNRALWVRNRDVRARCGRSIVIDRPAPQCPQCHRRPRENKGTRRGRRRYYRFCAPCYRRDREEHGLPAYRGVRGVRMWMRAQLRGRRRRPRHRTGRPVDLRPEWLTDNASDVPDPADLVLDAPPSPVRPPITVEVP